MPIPTRLLRWIRSKLSAITARTPSKSETALPFSDVHNLSQLAVFSR